VTNPFVARQANRWGALKQWQHPLICQECPEGCEPKDDPADEKPRLGGTGGMQPHLLPLPSGDLLNFCSKGHRPVEGLVSCCALTVCWASYSTRWPLWPMWKCGMIASGSSSTRGPALSWTGSASPASVNFGIGLREPIFVGRAEDQSARRLLENKFPESTATLVREMMLRG
jgi:hypothetical protein